MIKLLSNLIYLIFLGFCLLWLHQNSGVAQFEVIDWHITIDFSIFCAFLLCGLIGLIILWNLIQIFTRKIIKILHTEKKKDLESLQYAYYLFFAEDFKKCENELNNVHLNHNPDFQLLHLKLNQKNPVYKLEKLLQHKKMKNVALIMLIKYFHEQKKWKKTSHYLAVLQDEEYIIDNQSSVFFIKIEVLLHEKKYMIAKEILQNEIENQNNESKIFELFACTTHELAKDYLNQNEGKRALDEIKQTLYFDDSPRILQTYYEILINNDEREKIFPIIAMIYEKQLQIDEKKALSTAEFTLGLCFSNLEKRDIVANLIKLNEDSYVGYYLTYKILIEEQDLEGAFSQIQIAIEKNANEIFLLLEGLQLGFKLQKNNFCQHILEKISPTKKENIE